VSAPTCVCRAKAYIDHALAQDGRILVHCGDGISRSPAIVTAYVMCTQSLSTEDAFQYVQARRFCISPNQGFQHQIEAYQHIYEAAKQSAMDPALNLRASEGRKRDIEEDEAEEDDMPMGQGGSTGQRPVVRLPARNVHRRISPEDQMSHSSPFVSGLCFPTVLRH
jgi:serine/threonine/tyrosine-interacting protein